MGATRNGGNVKGKGLIFVLVFVAGVILGMALLQSENSRLRGLIAEDGFLVTQPRVVLTGGEAISGLAVTQMTVETGTTGVCLAPIVGEEHLAILAWVQKKADGAVVFTVADWSALGNKPPRFRNGKNVLGIGNGK
jgi:hypothetical protein